MDGPSGAKMSSSSSDSTELYAFGRNYYHALGGCHPVTLSDDTPAHRWQDEDDSKNPVSPAEVSQVACSSAATYFLSKDGSLYQVGTTHGRIWNRPSRVVIKLPLKCVQVAAGRHFGLARMEGGLAVCSWGAGHFGQLGLDARNLTRLYQPTVIEGLLPHRIGSPIVDIAAGSWHAMALTQEGRVFCWGSNRNHQCGRKLEPSQVHSTTPPTQATPLPVPTEHRFQKIACGRAHSMAIERETGNVYCWGASQYGQCGGTGGARKVGVAPPRMVEGLSRVTCVDICAGDAHSMALTTGGRVFSWGMAADGQLGHSNALYQPRPRLVADLDFVAICAGQDVKDSRQPATDLSTVPRIVSIYAAGLASAALSSAGHLYTWGNNDAAVLGLPRPTELPMDTPNLAKPTSSLRQLQVQTFDSRHNVLLPRRVDGLANINIKTVALGISFMWCLGTTRPPEESTPVGRTLYEVQEERRAASLIRIRESKIALAARTRAETNNDGDPKATSAKAQEESKEGLALDAEQAPPPPPPPDGIATAKQSMSEDAEPSTSPGNEPNQPPTVHVDGISPIGNVDSVGQEGTKEREPCKTTDSPAKGSANEQRPTVAPSTSLQDLLNQKAKAAASVALPDVDETSDQTPIPNGDSQGHASFEESNHASNQAMHTIHEDQEKLSPTVPYATSASPGPASPASSTTANTGEAPTPSSSAKAPTVSPQTPATPPKNRPASFSTPPPHTPPPITSPQTEGRLSRGRSVPKLLRKWGSDHRMRRQGKRASF